MKHLVVVELGPVPGSVACKVLNCGKKARVQINRYVGLDRWDPRGSGPVCHEHLAQFQNDWIDCELQMEAR